MNQPLSITQQALRGRKVTDMTDVQLRDWIDACDQMEAWVHITAKARRGWKAARVRAVTELARRNERR
jgi:hypothetical protein